MKNPTNIPKTLIWLPAAFCAVLSLMKMFFPNGAGDPAFYSCLPVCFFFVAAAHHALWKRIQLLEAALDENVAESEEAEI